MERVLFYARFVAETIGNGIISPAKLGVLLKGMNTKRTMTAGDVVVGLDQVTESCNSR